MEVRRHGHLPRRLTLIALTACLLALAPGLSAQYAKGKPFAKIAAEADAARDANQTEEAIALYKRALAIRPSWVEGWWSLGTLYYDQNNFTDASRAFQKVLAFKPKAGSAHVMLGLCEFELGHDEAALKHLEEGKAQGFANDPQLRRVMLFHEGLLLKRMGKYEAAQATLDPLCAQTPDDPQVTEALGNTVLRNRFARNAASDAAVAEVVKQIGEAQCLAAQKKFDEARQKMSAVVDASPKYPNVHYAFGKLLLDANDNDAAVEQFQQEIANNPNDVISRLRIAAAKYKIDSAGGLPFAEEAVKLDPQLPLGHYLLGLLLLDTDDYAKALPELEIARKAFPKEAKVHFALSSAYSKAGRTAEAAKERAEFVRLNQQNASAQTSESTAISGQQRDILNPKRTGPQ